MVLGLLFRVKFAPQMSLATICVTPRFDSVNGVWSAEHETLAERGGG